MIRSRKKLRFLMVASVLAIIPTGASGQDFIGDALGQLILPAVGPVLERAAGEVVLEGVRRGYENGRLLPRPGNGSSRQTIIQPRRQRSSGGGSPSYPQSTPYVPSQSSQTYSNQGTTYVEPAPAAPSPPTIAPPENRIVTRPSVSPNLSPIDIAMTHVVSAGPGFTGQVIRSESAEIAAQLDRVALSFLERDAAVPGGASFRSDYRRLLSKAHAENARLELLDSHQEMLADLDNREGFISLLQAADSADRVAALPSDVDHQSLTETIDLMRDDLTSVSGTIIAGDELAVLAQRAKNVRNMSVMSEIARVLGIERRDDLFSRVSEAADKSDAPVEAVAGLVGVLLAPVGHAVADMPLPDGVPSVVLYNPLVSATPISFVCDDALEVTLGPGELVPFDQAFVVAFQNGKGQVKRYSLKSGMFRWVIEDSQWDLRQKLAGQVTIDASHSPSAFHYLVNGQPQMVDGGSVIEHIVDGPIRIDFDMGLGDGTIKSTLVTPGHFHIGVNAETGGWDLHQAPEPGSVDPTTTSVAKELWRDNAMRVQQSWSSDPAEAKVDALLDLIE